VVACELCHGLGVRVVDAHATVVHAVGKSANARGVPGDLKSHSYEHCVRVRVRVRVASNAVCGWSTYAGHLGLQALPQEYGAIGVLVTGPAFFPVIGFAGGGLRYVPYANRLVAQGHGQLCRILMMVIPIFVAIGM
jgi:hypothetical protein